MFRSTAVIIGLVAILFSQGLAADDKVIDTKQYQIQEATILKFDKEVNGFSTDNPKLRVTFVVFSQNFSVPLNLFSYSDKISVYLREDGKDFTTLSAEPAEPILKSDYLGNYLCKSITLQVPVQDDIKRWQKYLEGNYKFFSFDSLHGYSSREFYSYWCINIWQFGPEVLVPVNKIGLVLKEKVDDKESIKVLIAIDANEFWSSNYQARSVIIYAFSQEEYNRIQKDLEDTKKMMEEIKKPKRITPPEIQE